MSELTAEHYHILRIIGPTVRNTTTRDIFLGLQEFGLAPRTEGLLREILSELQSVHKLITSRRAGRRGIYWEPAYGAKFPDFPPHAPLAPHLSFLKEIRSVTSWPASDLMRTLHRSPAQSC